MFKSLFKKSGKKNSSDILEERNSQSSNHHSEKFEKENEMEESERIDEQKAMDDSETINVDKPEVKDEIFFQEKLSNCDTIDERLYLDLELQVEEIQTENLSLLDNQNEKLDIIMMLLINKYGLESIDSPIFVITLEKLFIDIKLLNEKRNGCLKDYLNERVLSISDIKYWDNEEEVIYPCDISIFGRNILIKTHDVNKTKELTITIIHSQDCPISFIPPIIQDDGMWFTVIIDNYFILNTDKKNIVEKYLSDINLQILQDANNCVNEIMGEVNNASIKLKEIVANFLSMIPLEILLDKDEFIAFEQLAFFSNFAMQQLLDSSAQQRDEVINMLKEDDNFYSRINAFIINDFEKLTKIVGKYINYNEKYHSSVIWKLIRLEAIPFFSKEWIDNYEVYISNAAKINNLDDYVDAYCKASEILTKNIIHVGVLTYHLMNLKLFNDNINGNFVECNICLINKIFRKNRRD